MEETKIVTATAVLFLLELRKTVTAKQYYFCLSSAYVGGLSGEWQSGRTSFSRPCIFLLGGRGNSDCCQASPLLYFLKTTFGWVFVFAFTRGHHFPLWEISCKQIYVTKGFAKLKERKSLHYHCRVSKFVVTGQIWVVRVIIWRVTITHKIQWRPTFWILDFLNPQITSFT